MWRRRPNDVIRFEGVPVCVISQTLLGLGVAMQNKMKEQLGMCSTFRVNPKPTKTASKV